MITKLSIANFKSIRQLNIDCKKINLFIGEPNTGKSNILEALALLSWWARPGQNLQDMSDFNSPKTCSTISWWWTRRFKYPFLWRAENLTPN
jgi:AAA15 family ATPase/GTPase